MKIKPMYHFFCHMKVRYYFGSICPTEQSNDNTLRFVLVLWQKVKRFDEYSYVFCSGSQENRENSVFVVCSDGTGCLYSVSSSCYSNINSPLCRPWGNSWVTTTDPTWQTGDSAIWLWPRLAIRPAVGTHSASVALFNERIWANIWLPGGVAATPRRPGGVQLLPFKPGGIKRGPWISKVTKL